MNRVLENKNIILGVTGGIAAYKSVELLRFLKKAGADVNVVMTKAALEFVGETTFRVLSENRVCVDLFATSDTEVRHIDWAVNAHAVVIAPATANCIGKLAGAIADDALTTMILAVQSKILICPSMNTHMYENRLVQQNLDILEKNGFSILEPGTGELACKTTGAGRLPEPWIIFDRLVALLTPKDLKDKNILVSAGPTQEAIDPVRFISNHSSGKMGYAIAEAAEKRGGHVTLVSGPVSLTPPPGVDLVKVESAQEMADKIFAEMDSADIIVKVAAVADYRPLTLETRKIKKQDNKKGLTLELSQTLDILKEIGKRKKNQFVAGFAAETDNLEQNALSKMKKKNLDMIAANLVGVPDSGFQTDTNKVRLYFRNGQVSDIPLMDKKEVANRIWDEIISHMGEG
ncbi:MAG: bifunctional phosphopantothenoylcysteine decarboxylase/phosphopantothenate--cysteine ligase CoaBC [Thermodesulfobacteriota bacterium]|nr:bifunctional phosphopantothenoylcysteine decarboxylase/phosphopantothenate--cysteine ligase CoaBC [Thermodesulfobacteriota bacterium]